MKGNWSSSGLTKHTKECHVHFDWLHPKTLSTKNRYYGSKMRELLEIDVTVVRYGQDKVLSRDNGNFVKTNPWKPLFKKKCKHYIKILCHFVLSDGLALYIHQFENGFNKCGRNTTFCIIKPL